MKAETRKILRIILLLALVAAGVRLLIIYRSRHAAVRVEQKREAPLPADYYVVPKKLHAYDLKSAGELAKQPVWVRDGYRYTFYPYEQKAHHTDFAHEAGTLGPIEKLQITQVALERAPRTAIRMGEVRVNPNQQQLMAVFNKDGKEYAVPIGTENNGEYQINADEMFYVQDPHELYKHWPKEVWQAVEQHQAKPGMNELQVSFAIGFGIPQAGGADKLVKYPNGGSPLEITYQNGRAAQVKPSS